MNHAILERLRSIAARTLAIGETSRSLDDGADAITVDLEALLVGAECERCGRTIEAGEGQFERSEREPPLIVCGRCHNPKERP